MRLFISSTIPSAGPAPPFRPRIARPPSLTPKLCNSVLRNFSTEGSPPINSLGKTSKPLG